MDSTQVNRIGPRRVAASVLVLLWAAVATAQVPAGKPPFARRLTARAAFNLFGAQGSPFVRLVANRVD